MIEFAQLQAFVLVLRGICALIAAIAGAAAAVTKYWRFAHKQSDENANDIEEVKRWFAADKVRIENLEKHQQDTDDMNKMQLKALFTLLQHVIDGNNIDDVKAMRNEINEYLIEK